MSWSGRSWRREHPARSATEEKKKRARLAAAALFEDLRVGGLRVLRVTSR
jgi:hypothetical protein